MLARAVWAAASMATAAKAAARRISASAANANPNLGASRSIATTAETQDQLLGDLALQPATILSLHVRQVDQVITCLIGLTHEFLDRGNICGADEGIRTPTTGITVERRVK